jgi:hypothetical protein
MKKRTPWASFSIAKKQDKSIRDYLAVRCMKKIKLKGKGGLKND